MAYEQEFGPLGQERDDRLAALIASAVVNALKQKGEPIPADKFLPPWADHAGGNYGDDS